MIMINTVISILINWFEVNPISSLSRRVLHMSQRATGVVLLQVQKQRMPSEVE